MQEASMLPHACAAASVRLGQLPFYPAAPAVYFTFEITMKTLVLLLATLLMTACATTQFRPFEARANVFEGTGGTKSIVDGMEMWETGDPPRKFKVLGVIDDERAGGIISMSQLRADIVKKARETGGEAVILLNSQSRIAGYYSSGSATATTYGSTTTATGSGFTAPVRRNTARFIVIQYLE